MKRRDFLASSIGAAGMSALGASGGQAQTTNKPMPEYYELRQYHLRTTMRRGLQRLPDATCRCRR